jgi:hypothetical protein
MKVIVDNNYNKFTDNEKGRSFSVDINVKKCGLATENSINS